MSLTYATKKRKFGMKIARRATALRCSRIEERLLRFHPQLIIGLSYLRREPQSE